MRQSLTSVQQFDVINHYGYAYHDSDDTVDTFDARQCCHGALDWESDDDSVSTDVSNARYDALSCSSCCDWKELHHFR